MCRLRVETFCSDGDTPDEAMQFHSRLRSRCETPIEAVAYHAIQTGVEPRVHDARAHEPTPTEQGRKAAETTAPRFLRGGLEKYMLMLENASKLAFGPMKVYVPYADQNNGAWSSPRTISYTCWVQDVSSEKEQQQQLKCSRDLINNRYQAWSKNTSPPTLVCFTLMRTERIVRYAPCRIMASYLCEGCFVVDLPGFFPHWLERPRGCPRVQSHQGRLVPKLGNLESISM